MSKHPFYLILITNCNHELLLTIHYAKWNLLPYSSPKKEKKKEKSSHSQHNSHIKIK